MHHCPRHPGQPFDACEACEREFDRQELEREDPQPDEDFDLERALDRSFRR